MPLEHAARVTDPIAHTKDHTAGNIIAVLSVIGAVALLPVVLPAIAAGGGVLLTTLLVTRNVLQAVSFVGNVVGTGVLVGDVADFVLSGYEIEGQIVTGVPTVHIGLGSNDAANAFLITTVDCHDASVASGSITVSFMLFGASRRHDGTSCGGLIAAGCPTVLIGGDSAFTPGSEPHGETSPLRERMREVASYMSLAGAARSALPSRLRVDPRRPGGLGFDPVGAVMSLGDFYGVPGANSIGQWNRWWRAQTGRGSTTPHELWTRMVGVGPREIGRSGLVP